jgi:glucose-6-phosphate-specific signal transduction histidine kinase
MGLRWLLAPRGIAPEFGLALQSGIGLSSQIGDMAAFFLLLGICILTALVAQRRFWYYPPMILLSLTALSRVLAWLIHDAALPMNLIMPEIVVALIILVASRRLPDRAE